MSKRIIVALDGHDGAGKTTLAAALAASLGGAAVRPFSGTTGKALLEAGEQKDVAALLTIGRGAIVTAIASVPGTTPVILDRGWMTVASFVPESTDFFFRWDMWIPTTLCWAELTTTLSRLAVRKDDPAESVQWHQHYLAVYLDLARRYGSFIVRTDLMDPATCLEQLVIWARNIPENP